MVTHPNLHPISTTVGRFGLMINQITVTSKEYSGTSLSAKVLKLFFYPSHIFSFPNLRFLTLDCFAGFQFDYVFDWTILKYQQSQLTAPPSRGLVSPAVGTSAGLPPGLTSIDRYGGEFV